MSAPTHPTPASSRNVGAIALAFLFGVAVATYLHWPALTDRLTYKSDIRQSPHWAAYHLDSFRDDDLLVLYGSFNESPVQNAIYWVGTLFVDYIPLTKIVAVLAFGGYAAVFFAAGASMFNRRVGMFAVIFVTMFPDQFDYAAGGFSKMWMIPLLMVAVWVVETRRWRVLWWLMPFAALAYPVCAVLIGATAVMGVLLQALRHRDPRLAWRELLQVGVGSVLGVLPLGWKYLATPPEVGPMTPRAELIESSAMYRGGLSHYLPTPPIWEAFAELTVHPFIIGAAILFVAVLGRKVVFRRSWMALLVASVICYIVADLVFLRLYFPNRYLRYSMAVLLALWHAVNFDLLFERIPRRSLRVAAFAVLMVVGVFLFRDTLEQGKDTGNRNHRAPLNRFLATEPEKILVAGHPRDMDDIPVQARRSVLTNYKMNHSWFVNFRDEMDRRTRDSFRALYAFSAEDVNLLHEKYGVTHFVVTTKYFEQRRIRRDWVYVEPYEEMIRQLAEGRHHFFLKDPPRGSMIWAEEGRYVLKLPIPERSGRTP